MGRINVLEKQVAELIAAGEVVERPASIVKELVENSIDAGSSSITVEIRGGGISLIRITDNGSGIEHDDVPKAFLRHATSKVRNSGDLNHIMTMGFRGEALASIAAMSRVELVTRIDGEIAGTRCVVNGGEQEAFEETGCPIGTIITVRDVFYNTPARMKFLKKDVTEGNCVQAVVEKAALAEPSIAFRFLRDGTIRMQTPGDGKILSVCRVVFGREFSDNALNVCYTHEGISIEGLICKPEIARSSRTLQNFFINRRFVRSRTCMAALEEAYKGVLMVGKFPSCALNLIIPPQTVDVNVHPAKTEVRFANEKNIFSLVYYGCKTALSIANLTPELTETKKHFNPFATQQPIEIPKQQRLDTVEYRRLVGIEVPRTIQVPKNYRALDIEKDTIPHEVEPIKECEVNDIYSNVKVIGEIFTTYIVLQSENELILVDKHAAHERLLFNRLMQNGTGNDRQILLSPVTVKLSAEEYSAVLENLTLLEKAGIAAEDFGDGCVLVREAAPILADTDLAGIVTEFAQKLLHGSEHLISQRMEELFHTIACRAAIKAGDRTETPSLEQLILLLREDGDASHCPHGRPVALRMPKHLLEKKFGRLG